MRRFFGSMIRESVQSHGQKTARYNHNMALIAQGPLGSVSGKLGALEFARGRSSATVKCSKSTVRRHSTAAREAQAAMSEQRAAWQALNVFDKLAWCTAAAAILRTNRLGAQRTISGYNLYMAQAPLARHMGSTYIDSPPIFPSFEQPLDLALDPNSGGAFIVSFAPPTCPAFYHTLWYGCRHAPLSLSTTPKRWTQLGWIDTSSEVQDITAIWTATLGMPPPGEYIAVTCSLWSKRVVHSPRSWCLAQVY